MIDVSPQARSRGEVIPWGSIMTTPSFWGCIIGYFGCSHLLLLPSPSPPPLLSPSFLLVPPVPVHLPLSL